MKIIEFSKKYNVNYTVVLRASHRLNNQLFARRSHMQFDEKELGKAVEKELKQSVARYKKLLDERLNEYNNIHDWFGSI